MPTLSHIGRGRAVSNRDVDLDSRLAPAGLGQSLSEQQARPIRQANEAQRCGIERCRDVGVIEEAEPGDRAQRRDRQPQWPEHGPAIQHERPALRHQTPPRRMFHGMPRRGDQPRHDIVFVARGQPQPRLGIDESDRLERRAREQDRRNWHRPRSRVHPPGGSETCEIVTGIHG